MTVRMMSPAVKLNSTLAPSASLFPARDRMAGTLGRTGEIHRG
jgi:hypothetical protein